MELDEITTSGRYTIDHYNERGFWVLRELHDSAIVVSAQKLQTISQDTFDDTAALLEKVAEHETGESGTVLIIGTGAKQQFPKNERLKALMYDAEGCKRAVEIMDSGAACRTYNLLVGDDRPVIAVMLTVGA